MCAHSLSVHQQALLPPRAVGSLGVVLCGLGHCCTASCSVLAPALGDVWFTWQRTPSLTSLVVLQSNQTGALAALVHAVNNCTYKDRIRVRTRSIDDRGHAITLVTSSPPPHLPPWVHPPDPSVSLRRPARPSAPTRRTPHSTPRCLIH